jgi:hypothetical protein
MPRIAIIADSTKKRGDKPFETSRRFGSARDFDLLVRRSEERDRGTLRTCEEAGLRLLMPGVRLRAATALMPEL